MAAVGCLIGVVVVGLLVGLVSWKVASSHDTEEIPDDAFRAPPRARVVSDDGGSCGNGNDFECGRVYTVLGEHDESAEALRDRVIDYLADDKGWDRATFRSDGWVCREDGHFCVLVLPFRDDWPHAAGSADERRWAEVFSIPRASLPELRARGVSVSFSDCCGDGWPF
jgi:hypothetical protein